MISLLYIQNNTTPPDPVRQCLEKRGDFSVTSVPSTARALQVLHDRPFDAILSTSPPIRSDGISLLRSLRKTGDLTPFICLTNDEDDEDVIQALAHGADLCLSTRDLDPDHTTVPQKIQALVRGRMNIYTPQRTPCGISLMRPEISGEDTRPCITLLDSLLDGIVIIDLQGRVLYANRAAREIGETTFEGDEGDIHTFIAPAYTAEVETCLQRCRQRCQTDKRTFSFECPIVTRKRETKVIEAFGNTIGYHGHTALEITFRDITQRKQAEKALREAEKNNRELVQGIPEYVVVYSDTRGVIFTNHAAKAALGGGPDALPGTSFLSLAAEEYRDTFEGVVADARTGKETGPTEIMFRTLDGEALPVTVRAAPITYQDEDAMLFVMTDITERMVLEKELEYHAAELKRFSESLARINEKLTIMGNITRHDILNQLTVLMAHLEIAEEDGAQDPGYPEHLRLIHLAATNIKEQIEFTRDYQEIGVRAPQWCNLEYIIARLKSTTLTVQSEVKGVEIYADPLFRKVFYNLLDNAERHGGGARTVRVSCHEEEGGLLILWEDDGIGVGAKEKGRIFKRGYGHNTGFGLFLSREILSITGIQIKETGEEGKGARFEVLIPKGGYRQARSPSSVPSSSPPA